MLKMTIRKQRHIWGFIFVSPWLLGTAVLFLWSIGRTIALSFQQVTDLANLQTEWIGLANYSEVFRGDVKFLPTLGETMINLALNVPLTLVFSLVMAVLLRRVGRAQTLLRAIFFLPVVIGTGGVITELLSAGAAEDMVSGALETIQRATVSAEAQSSAAGLITPIQGIIDRMSLITWHTGVQILLFMAGLNSIPRSLYEAARVDGAGGWESFWKITLPMLSPVIMVAAVYTLVETFTDPLNQVNVYIYEVSLGPALRLGYGAALGVAYFAVVFLLVSMTMWSMSRGLFYAGVRQ